jgi:hypothetical protein
MNMKILKNLLIGPGSPRRASALLGMTGILGDVE